MKVLFAASEAYPFAMSGGLADVAGALPKALRRRLIGARVVLPLYECVPEELRKNMKFITSITVPVAWRRQYCGIFEAKYGGVIYYLLDNQYYFKRDALYGYYDDAERFAFFSRAVLEMIPHISFKPDVIHCNDWQTAMTPIFYKLMYKDTPGYENIKTVFTIHNIQYQGKYGHELIGEVLGIPDSDADVVDYDDSVNLMKGGIECCDWITTVSPTYAKEIMDPWFAYGLDTELRFHGGKLSGIVNGIDYDVYNPEADPLIYKTYSADTADLKAENKRQLQERLGLPVREDVPVIAIVSRMVSHKGLDLVKYCFEELLGADVQYVILGSGDLEYESFFSDMAAKHSDKVSLTIGFFPELAHKIYAASDIFLMPSKNEPCGLSQMVALRYGSIPVVRETGGLADTITDSGDGSGNGFIFKTYNAGDMSGAVWRAIEGYKNQEGWKILVKRAMGCNNSWNKSANDYINLYKHLIGK